MKTRMAQAAAGRLLLENPDGMTRGQITKKLGLKPRAWQSIKKHPMFKQHPDNTASKGRGTRWIVDRKLLVDEYGLDNDGVKLTHEQRAKHIVNARKLNKAKTVPESFADMVPTTADVFTSPPPTAPISNLSKWMPVDLDATPAGKRVTIVIDGVNIDMDIAGSVTFTING